MKIKIKSNIFNLSSIFYFFSNLISNFLNYAINIFLGWFFSKAIYGLINALFALINILALPTIILQTIVSNLVSEKSKSILRLGIFLNYFKISFIISLIILIFGLVFSGYLADFLHTREIFIYFILFIAFFSLPLSVIRGYLQGSHKFASLGLSFMVETILKFILTVLFLEGFNLGVIGVLLSILLSAISAFIYGLYQIFSEDKYFFKKYKNTFKGNYKLSYFIYMSVAILSIVVLTNIDVIFVQSFINSYSGYYGVFSRLGQIILMISSILISLLIPKLLSAYYNKENSINFFHGFLVVFIFSFILFLLYYLFPKFFISLLFGEKYTTYYTYFPIIAFSYFLNSLSLYAIHYLIGFRYFKVVYFILLPLFFYIILAFVHNESFYSFILNFLFSSIALFVLVYINILIYLISNKNDSSK